MPTLDLAVAASADDAHESQGDTNFSSTAITVDPNSNTTITSRLKGGFRFILSAAIPTGSTITVAYITPNVTTNARDDPNLDIYAEQSSNPVNYSTNADVNNRALTAASAAWVATGIGSGDRQSPSIVSVIQELIDDYGGLASGAAINIIMVGRADANNNLRLRAYDDGPGTNPADLHLEWTEPAGAADSLASLFGKLKRRQQHLLVR